MQRETDVCDLKRGAKGQGKGAGVGGRGILEAMIDDLGRGWGQVVGREQCGNERKRDTRTTSIAMHHFHQSDLSDKTRKLCEPVGEKKIKGL